MRRAKLSRRIGSTVRLHYDSGLIAEGLLLAVGRSELLLRGLAWVNGTERTAPLEGEALCPRDRLLVVQVA